MNPKRVFAIFLRQAYLYRRSFPRLLEVFYWPTMDILLWGFVSIYLQKSSTGLPGFVAFFLGALILWDILFRAQQGITVSFLEDMWARNLLNIFVTPLKINEYICGLLLVSVLKVIISFSVMSVLAGLLYSFNIFKLGVMLIPLIINLVAMGWALGILTTGFILRFGQEAEVLAWAVAFLFMPFSAVFYPVDVLPPVIKTISFFIPASHVFEGMRTLINSDGFPSRELIIATILNVVYLSVALIVFKLTYRKVLKDGLIPKIGE
ncbi:MAG: ABC transporter permease [Nitrospirae bacterium]|nr:ABC transporter permease [Nitrospirota bacterium]